MLGKSDDWQQLGWKMQTFSMRRNRNTAAMAGGISLLTLMAAASAADVQSSPSQSNVFQNGQAGFVVSHIAYALSKDASETGACPDGMTKGYGKSAGFTDIGDVFVGKPDLQRHDGEVEDQYVRRVFTQAM